MSETGKTKASREQHEAFRAFAEAVPEKGMGGLAAKAEKAVARPDSPPKETTKGKRRKTVRSADDKLHRILSFALVVFLALVPFPAGANRPGPWLMWAAVLFAGLGLYLVALHIRRLALPRAPGSLKFVLLGAAAFLAMAILQILPLGSFTPLVGKGGPAFGLLKNSVNISMGRDATMIAAVRWLSYAVFFFLMLQAARRQGRARKIGWAVFAVVLAHSIYGLAANRFVLAEGVSIHGLPPVTGAFVNRNSFATFVGFGLVLGFSLMFHSLLRANFSRRRLFRLISGEVVRGATLWVGLAVMGAALLATGSRMGVAASGMGLLAAGLMLVRKHRHSTFTGIALLAVATGIVGVIGALIFGQGMLERAIFSIPDGGRRADLYALILDIIRQRPLIGTGLDTFELAFEQVHRPPVSPDLVWSRAHSTYLALWSEMGLIFGSLPMLIIVLLAIRLLKTLRARKHSFVLSVAALGVIVLAGVHSTVDFSLEMPANVFLFLAIIALGLADESRRGLKRARPGGPAKER